MKDELIKKAVSATKSLIIFKIAGEIVSLGITIFLVRYLSENYYGIYNLLYSTIGLTVAFISLGLNDTLNRFIPEYYQKGEFILANRLYRIASLLRLLANIVVIIVIFGLWHYVASFLKIEPYRDYFLLFSPIIILFTQWSLINICLNSYFLQKYTQMFYLIFMLLKGIGYVIVFLFKLDLRAVIFVDIIGFIILLILLQYVYAHKIPMTGGSYKFLPQEKKRLFRYSFYYNFNDLGVQLLDVNIDNFILVYFLNPVAVGVYSFCNRISKLIGRFIPTNYLMDVIRPAFFSAYSTEKEGANKFFQFMIKITYIFYLPIFVIFAIYNKEIINLITGGKYIEYGGALVMVFLFQILSAFQLPLGLVAQLNERAEIILYSRIFGIYNLIADIIMIRWWGVMGAVIATGTAMLFKNIFIWWFVRKDASFKGMGKFFEILMSLSILIAIIMFSIKILINIRGALQLFYIVLLISFTYLLFFKYILNQKEKDVIINLLPSKITLQVQKLFL